MQSVRLERTSEALTGSSILEAPIPAFTLACVNKSDGKRRESYEFPHRWDVKSQHKRRQQRGGPRKGAAQVAEGKGLNYAEMERDSTSGGERTMLRTGDVLWNCTLETHTILLTNATRDI